MALRPSQTGDLFGRNDAPFALEGELRRTGFKAVAGVDEAGRGALAGPVVAAAVVLSPRAACLARKVRDSKKLSPRERAELFPRIYACARHVGVGIVEPEEIDRVNILQASLRAMALAIGGLGRRPDLCLIDGNRKVPVAVAQRCIVRGDDRVLSISAASIVAKVIRDRLMQEMSREYPAYGFDVHKGYGTGHHLEAILRHGISPVHRRSFALPHA